MHGKNPVIPANPQKKDPKHRNNTSTANSPLFTSLWFPDIFSDYSSV